MFTPMRAWYSSGQERALNFLTLELALSVSHLVDGWEINTGTLQEQRVLLIAESSLQPDDFAQS